jgi:HsdM N-terminal domain
MKGFQDKVNFIWLVANEILRDDSKRSKHPEVILLFTLLRGVDCVLEPTKDKLLERYKSSKAAWMIPADRMHVCCRLCKRIGGNFTRFRSDANDRFFRLEGLIRVPTHLVKTRP